MNWQDLLTYDLSFEDVSDVVIFNVLRNWRNAQLAASDWTQLSDVSLTSDKAEAWRQYRQELRDMLKQNDDPKLIVFPEPPK